MNTQPSRNLAPIDRGVKIGHVHLKVADLQRSLDFYCDVLGFRITQRYGDSAVFIAAGDYHHHIGLNTWQSANGSPPPNGSVGLYHFAILYPRRALLADALRRLLEAGIALDGASDHGVSEALYLRDPDNNGLELYWDKPREEWPVAADGKLQMYSRPLELDSLLGEQVIEDTDPSDKQHMRLRAFDRWENEGGAVPHGISGDPNPEETHALRQSPPDPSGG